MNKSQVKAVIVFFNNRSIIMIEWMPEGQTVNQSEVLLGTSDWLLRTSKEEKARIVEE
jgi:hypothetical protein